MTQSRLDLPCVYIVIFIDLTYSKGATRCPQTHLVANQVLLVAEPRQTDVDHPVALGLVARVQVHVPAAQQRLQLKVQHEQIGAVVVRGWRVGKQHQRKREPLDGGVALLGQQRSEARSLGELLRRHDAGAGGG